MWRLLFFPNCHYATATSHYWSRTRIDYQLWVFYDQSHLQQSRPHDYHVMHQQETALDLGKNGERMRARQEVWTVPQIKSPSKEVTGSPSAPYFRGQICWHSVCLLCCRVDRIGSVCCIGNIQRCNLSWVAWNILSRQLRTPRPYTEHQLPFLDCCVTSCFQTSWP